MGLIAKYHCAICRYASRELCVGEGEECARRLVSCPRCKVLREVDAKDVAAGCKRHRVPFVVHRNEMTPPCPRCGATLTCSQRGTWD